MPRLLPSLIRRARAANTLLVPLLKTCRNLASASNELRWLTEHVQHTVKLKNPLLDELSRGHAESWLLKKLCNERGKGKPLQYLLGTEYFGNLELICRPGVLIPRPATADITTELARRLKQAIQRGVISDHLRILDLCTGTGCMALLLHSALGSALSDRCIPQLTLGVDVSCRAIQTAMTNKRRLGFLGDNQVQFMRADILDSVSNESKSTKASKPNAFEGALNTVRQWDVVVANPPYISPHAFNTTKVERSVRLFEPRSALAPQTHHKVTNILHGLDPVADAFYPHILDIAHRVGAKVVLLEVGGSEQAERVRKEAQQRALWENVELWKDGISFGAGDDARSLRAVICSRAEGNDWIKA